MTITIPYGNRKVDLQEHLSGVLASHSQNTPYWKDKFTPKEVRRIVKDNLEDTLYSLSKLEVDPQLLRTRWTGFTPENLKNARCSFSSGTTGPQKYCLWGEDYINSHTDYLAYYITKQGIEIKNAIIQGPSSVYKDLNERFIHRIGGNPYFIGLRVEGVKPIMEQAAKKGHEEITRVMKEYFGIEIEKTKAILEHDDKINFMRSAWMILAPFEEFFGDKRNVDTVMVSGLGYSAQTHEMLKSKFKNVIPSYGYFAFGDALGVCKDDNVDYYPTFPHTIATVVRDNGDIAQYGEEGHPLFVIARPDLFLVLKESNEFATRVPPTGDFNWDGIRNPRR